MKKNGKKELCHLKSVYKEMVCYSRCDERLINKIIDNSIQFDSPDIISNVNDEIYAFEHFEFDYYENNKDGSKFRKEQATDEMKIISTIKYRKTIRLNKAVASKASTNLFINNFIKCFDNHYRKIEEYKANLDSYYDKKRKHLWFVCEIISPLGCVAQTENGVELISPLMFNKVYNTIKNKNEIDGLIIVNYGSFLVIPKRDYKKASRNYKENDIKFVLTNPMEFKSVVRVDVINKE